jgi:Outer membrane protein beta-barrel domain
MKKLGLVIVVTMAFQSAFSQFSLGVKGGVNTSKLYTNTGSFKSNFRESLDTKTGYAVGAFGRIGKKLYLQPEVLFTSKGGKIAVIPLSGGSPVSVNIKTNNIDVPVLVGYKLFNRIRLNAGPVASIKISENQKFVEELRKVTGNIDQAFEEATFGYQAGVGFKLLGLDIDLRKDGSLSDISAARFGNDDKFRQRLSGWQLTIGFKII